MYRYTRTENILTARHQGSTETRWTGHEVNETVIFEARVAMHHATATHGQQFLARRAVICSENRAMILNRVWKVIRIRFSFAVLQYVIGEKVRVTLLLSEKKTKTLITHIFALIYNCFIALFGFVVNDQGNFFGFGFMTFTLNGS